MKNRRRNPHRMHGILMGMMAAHLGSMSLALAVHGIYPGAAVCGVAATMIGIGSARRIRGMERRSA
jgi:CHASE2 domain-containing sensor protein